MSSVEIKSLPKGWEWKPLGEVCKTGAGGTPLKSRKDFYENGDIPWLLSGEVAQGEIFEPKNFITKLGLEKSSAKLFPINTVLVAMYGATAGQVGLLKVVASTNQAVCGIYPNDKFLPKFVYYFFLMKKEDLIAQAAGNAQPNISQTKIKRTLIPIPPLAEQQKIVTLLDQAFADIQQAQANIEQNIVNAKELSESILENVYSSVFFNQNNKTLNELCELIVDCEHKTAPRQETGYPSIRTPNIGKNELLLKGVYRVSEETYKKWTRRAIPREGDLIMAREAPAGNVTVIPKGLNVCLGQRTLLIRPKKEIIYPDFLAFYLLTPTMQKTLLSHSKGATVTHINMRDIRNLKINTFPIISVQKETVYKAKKILKDINFLKSIYQQKLDNLEELKKSLLEKAFSGALTRDNMTAS